MESQPATPAEGEVLIRDLKIQTEFADSNMNQMLLTAEGLKGTIQANDISYIYIYRIWQRL